MIPELAFLFAPKRPIKIDNTVEINVKICKEMKLKSH